MRCMKAHVHFKLEKCVFGIPINSSGRLMIAVMYLMPYALTCLGSIILVYRMHIIAPTNEQKNMNPFSTKDIRAGEEITID
jgi:hypothetical protein